jgi:hypothetical protein
MSKVEPWLSVILKLVSLIIELVEGRDTLRENEKLAGLHGREKTVIPWNQEQELHFVIDKDLCGVIHISMRWLKIYNGFSVSAGMSSNKYGI